MGAMFNDQVQCSSAHPKLHKWPGSENAIVSSPHLLRHLILLKFREEKVLGVIPIFPVRN